VRSLLLGCEPDWLRPGTLLERVKEILDNALKVKPRRQMSVQFSGGEPTLSPHFLDAVAKAKKLGYNSVQAATNGIEFAIIRAKSSAGKRSKRAYATPTCSLTASATTPTATA
jgi:uncharacterized radical SAM superfamily Fe-S cluster-containing enzyme